MWSWTITAAILAAVPVEVETLAGQKHVGDLASWTDTAVVVSTADGDKSVPQAELASLQPRRSASAVAPPPQAAESIDVDLVDGTTLVASNFTVAAGKASVKLFGGETIEFPVRHLASVQLSKLDMPELRQQWEQIRQSKPAGDLVVVRKGEALDYLEGVLGSISETEVQFRLDGEDIAVKRSKLSGIVYFQNAPPKLTDLQCVFTATDGSRIHAGRVTQKDPQHFQLLTQSGVNITWAWDQAKLLDFTAGKVVYLATLVPEKSEWTPYLHWPQAALLKAFGQPALDRALTGGPLRYAPRGEADKKEFGRGISLRSRTELIYRLPAPYRRFKAVAFLDANAGGAGDVHLVISGDDRTLYEGSIAGQSAPVELDVDLSGVRRLKIRVDYGNGIDIADQLDLADARVTQ